MSYLKCGKVYHWYVCEDDPEHPDIPCPHKCKLPSCPDCARERAAVVVEHYTAAARWAVTHGPELAHADYRLKHCVFTGAAGLLDSSGKPDLSPVPWWELRRFKKNVDGTFDDYFRAWRAIARLESDGAPLRTAAAKLLYRHLLAWRKDTRRNFFKYRWYEDRRAQLAAGVPWVKLHMGYFAGGEFGEKSHKLHAHLEWYGAWLQHDVMQLIWKKRTGWVNLRITAVDDVEKSVKETAKYVTKLTELPPDVVPALHLALHRQRRLWARGFFATFKHEKRAEAKPVCCRTCGAPMRKLTEEEYQDVLEVAAAGGLESHLDTRINTGITQHTSGAGPPAQTAAELQTADRLRRSPPETPAQASGGPALDRPEGDIDEWLNRNLGRHLDRIGWR